MNISAVFKWGSLLVCVLVLDLAKRLPEHLLPDDYTDYLRTEFMRIAIGCDQELSPMDDDLDAFWTTMTTDPLQVGADGRWRDVFDSLAKFDDSDGEMFSP